MKRILVVLNSQFVPQYMALTAINMAKATASFLHVIFTDYNLNYPEYQYPFPNDLSLTRNDLTGKTIAEENAAIQEDNMRLFSNQCKEAGVNFFIEADNDIRQRKLVLQSAFSDFILADGNENAEHGHMADLLHNIHCPVYLVSKTVKTISTIVLTYDGKAASLYAIKTFTYLFREFKNTPVQLVYISSDKDSQLPHEHEIRDWLSTHYSNLQLHILQGELQDELTRYTRLTSNALVVMGAFGRSPVSSFFHKSLAYAVMNAGNASLFIAHPPDSVI